ncbi:uncharacterized protein [Lolium perenne]|uniref:uncharacterized protein n=1 Tax=Lolium perenne TaxID=4522 RepID=UPI0021F5105C|nr:uncharacterized protein LOC127318503 [Lolium perenne]XP_051204944.1 uncharacterized protein LOC127318503 [Lolium perenne]XP_051204945.1 uncharacterized protein LOC127318503 [Lolium perenne]XP_051204946.1 uncharacterized protein LOC127318503 [Lolium perenne]
MRTRRGRSSGTALGDWGSQISGPARSDRVVRTSESGSHPTGGASSHHSAAASPAGRPSAMSSRSERSLGSAYATPATIFGDLSRGSAASASGSAASSGKSPAEGTGTKRKPPFRPAPDDTKPVLRDPISRSDPVETEQAVLRLPPFP